MTLLTEGTKIVKTNSKPGDTHQDGAKGVIKKVIETLKKLWHLWLVIY